MKKAILGKKLGMTQIFAEDGTLIPVTVIAAGPCSVVQVKTVETDGYNAVQIGFGSVKENKVNKPKAGHFAKAGVKAVKNLREFRVEEVSDVKVGDKIKVDTFNVGDSVDIQGTTKGKGFQGVVKRWNIRIQYGKATRSGKGRHRYPKPENRCTTGIPL